MTGRLLLAACLVFCACKKDKGTSSEPPTSGDKPTTTTPPTGAKRVSDEWKQQTGPGFTVLAPNAATVEKVPAADDERAFDRYTFLKSGLQSLVVEITELPADVDLGMSVANLRMLITTRTQSVRSEDYISGGEVTGRDLRYIVDEGDDTLHARSQVLGKNHRLVQVRGVAERNAAGEELVDKFVDSFKFTP